MTLDPWLCVLVFRQVCLFVNISNIIICTFFSNVNYFFHILQFSYIKKQHFENPILSFFSKSVILYLTILHTLKRRGIYAQQIFPLSFFPVFCFHMLLHFGMRSRKEPCFLSGASRFFPSSGACTRVPARAGNRRIPSGS